MVHVVTGFDSGIGLATYELFDERFQRVIGVSRNDGNLATMVGIERTIQAIKSQFVNEKIGALVNNAGFMVLEESPEDFLSMMYCHCLAPYMIVKRLFPHFQPGACIVNVASVSGITGEEDTPFYAASKAALINMTKSMARKYAPALRVNCVSPGLTRTNLVPGETPADLLRTSLLMREADPRDIAETILMLVENPSCTGTNIVVDGGKVCK